MLLVERLVRSEYVRTGVRVERHYALGILFTNDPEVPYLVASYYEDFERHITHTFPLTVWRWIFKKAT